MKKLLTIAATILGGYSIFAADLRISDLPISITVEGSNTVPTVVTPGAIGGLHQISWSNVLNSLKLFPNWPGANATNAISDINNNSSNHQYLELTTNGFFPALSSGSGTGGATNSFNLPQATNFRSGFILSNDWTQFKGAQSGSFILTNFLFLGMSNVDLTQFTISQGKLLFRDKGVITNLVNWMGVNGDHGSVTWTNTLNDGRPALVDSNRTPIFTLRHTNDPLSPSILHSKIYYGGGTESGFPFGTPGHYWEDHQFLLPDFVNDVVTDPAYVQLSINYDDRIAWIFRQNRFLIQDTAGSGTSPSGYYNVLSNELNLVNISHGDTNANTRIYGRGITLHSQVIPADVIPYLNGHRDLTNLTIGAGLSLVAGTLTATASGGSPGGGDKAVQFNQGGATLAGTNRFEYDRSVGVEMLTLKVASAPTPALHLQDTSAGDNRLYITPNSIVQSNGAFLVVVKNNANLRGWYMESLAASAVAGSWSPLSDTLEDIGNWNARVRTNYTAFHDYSNSIKRGWASNSAAAPFVLGTNLVFNGATNDYFETFITGNSGGNGLTNFIFTNIVQSITVECWVTNGCSVNLMFDAGNSFPAGWYYDQAIIPVDTNGPTRITVWKTSRGTNVLVKTKTFSLAAAGSNALLTNYITGQIIVTNSASGAGGSTNFDSIFVTNQTVYVPLELNGSNSVTPTATYNWDMRLNTFRPITNFVNTNVVFTLSNVIRGASGISAFIGSGNALSNTVVVAATSGINIKWMNWATNGNSDLLVRPNYSYVLQFFADRDTNVNAWVSTDDPYNPLNLYTLNSWSAGVSNFVGTNILVQAGRSSSNATVGGTMFISTTAFTNLLTTFTNIATYTVPANTLTNNGDQIIADWAGRILSGTNTFNFGYTGANTNILSIGSLTNLGPINYSARLVLTRTSANAVHADGYFSIPPGNGVYYSYTNVNAEIATDTGTNSQLVMNTAQGTSTRPGSLTNNFFKVRYEPTSR